MFLVKDFEENNESRSERLDPCLTLADSVCFTKAFYKVDIKKCASDYCPLECDSIQYDISVSSLIYPSLNDYYNLHILESYEEWRTQSVRIIVYYPQLDYTSIQETPAMTLANLAIISL